MPYDFETLYCKERYENIERETIFKLTAGLGNLYIANREGNRAIIVVKKDENGSVMN
jgi:hypothetical protein